MRNTPTALMLFAAGFGTRMGDLTRDRPKPLIPVGGTPLIDHALGLARGAGCSPIVANTHYLAALLEDHLAGTGVLTIRETPDILETGGGLRNALPLLGTDPVITLNTDAIWAGPNPIPLLQDAWKPEDMDALLMCLQPEGAVGHTGTGDFALKKDGRISRGGPLIYGGLQIIKTDLLADVPEPAFSLNLIWDRMLARGRVFGMAYPGKWCDVGHPDGIADAETLLQAADV